MLQPNPVYVLSYDSNWPKAFEEIRKSLGEKILSQAIAVEHVGSTSVPNLAAKPIIDLDLVIPKGQFELFKAHLEELGYQHEGDNGIPGREAFRYESKPQLLKHHLYVCEENSLELHKHLTFRNWLRNHTEDREAYAAVKMEMAEKFRQDRDAYQNGKSAIIEEIYKKCGL
jgi:GrpB-like predicted nucleotidyltransferase (UPF0157 family)